MSELAAACTTHDKTKAAVHAPAEAYDQEMEEAEKAYLSKHIDLKTGCTARNVKAYYRGCALKAVLTQWKVIARFCSGYRQDDVA